MYALWGMPTVLALGRWAHEDPKFKIIFGHHSEFEASPGYLGTFSKEKKRQKKKRENKNKAGSVLKCPYFCLTLENLS